MTPEEIKTCAELLKKLEPGFLPLEIFAQVARLTRIPVVMIIPINNDLNSTSVGLNKRSTDDIWWPGQLALPGTIIRAKESLEDAMDRLLNIELEVLENDKPVFHTFLINETKRGSELVLVYALNNCKLKDTSSTKFFSIDELNDNVVDSDRKIILEYIKSLR